MDRLRTAITQLNNDSPRRLRMWLATLATVSALLGQGLQPLLDHVASRLALAPRRVKLRFAAGDRRGIARVYATGRVLHHDVEDGQGYMIGGLLTALDQGLEPVAQQSLGRETWLNDVARYPDGSALLLVGFDEVLELGPIGVGESGTAI